MSSWSEQGAILWHYGQTLWRARRFSDRSSLDAWQDRQIGRLIRRVRAMSPYYRSLWGDADGFEWRTLPTLDKTAMMRHFDELNTAGIRKAEAFELALRAESSRDFSPRIGDVTVGLSSGTSGHRGLFLASPHERRRWAGTVLAKTLPGPLWQTHRIAFFLRANSPLYASVASRRIAFQFFDLFWPLERHLAALNRFQPTLLAAPPSMLTLLAEARQSGALTMRPQKVISVAETLEPWVQRRLENAFEQPIHQVYQCTEGFLASTCRLGTLHVNEDLVAIQKEYLDRERGWFTPIVTDFSRLSQPIIRYRLNDLLCERSAPCPCGSVFTALEAIDGRCDDVLYFPALENKTGEGTPWVPLFPDFIRRAILFDDGPIRDYQARQIDAGHLTIGIAGALGPAGEETIRAEIHRACQRHRCQTPIITFGPCASPAPGVKTRRIQRDFRLPPDDADGR